MRGARAISREHRGFDLFLILRGLRWSKLVIKAGQYARKVLSRVGIWHRIQIINLISPKYLHSNSTSHTGPFSAIAELIDNAYDPDVNAKQIWIDKTKIRDMECLTFRDDGNGLSSDLMHHMLSFGYSDKKAEKGKLPIGIYGNGFKSGSMRLGQDAIILSKSENEECVGMLSQTYLEKIQAKQITVPIISTKKPGEKHVMEEHQASLRDILEHSPFNTEDELLTELHAIEGPTGTKIIIWNLRRTSEGNTELDFTTENDIRIICDDLDTSISESNSSLSVSSSDLSCLQGMAAHTECRVRDQNLMMQH
ncbi:unnamed protein product [Arctogadus glacialis]